MSSANHTYTSIRAEQKHWDTLRERSAINEQDPRFD